MKLKKSIEFFPDEAAAKKHLLAKGFIALAPIVNAYRHPATRTIAFIMPCQSKCFVEYNTRI